MHLLSLLSGTMCIMEKYFIFALWFREPAGPGLLPPTASIVFQYSPTFSQVYVSEKIFFTVLQFMYTQRSIFHTQIYVPVRGLINENTLFNVVQSSLVSALFYDKSHRKAIKMSF